MTASVGLLMALVVAMVVLVHGAPSVRLGGRSRRRVQVHLEPSSPVSAGGAIRRGARARSAIRSIRRRLAVRATGRRYEHRLPDALEALARGLRAGSPLAAALRTAAAAVDDPVAADLRTVATQLEHGLPASDAFTSWSARRPLPGVRLAVASLVVGTELGGSRARAVDRVAAGLRERAAVAREVVALASQARLSALVVALAPVLFALLGVAGNRDVAQFLFLSPAGWACVLGGAVLDAGAAWWMLRIVERAGR